MTEGFPGGAGGKERPAKTGDVRDVGSISGSGRSPGEGHGNPLQYSCLENLMDRGAWRATVRRVAKSRTRLKRLNTALAGTDSITSDDKDFILFMHFAKKKNREMRKMNR